MAQAHYPDATPEEAVEQLQKDAAAGRQTLAGEKTTIAEFESCQSGLKNCQGQAAYLNEKLEASGSGGFGHPPCWVTPEGRIEYIFAVHLTDAGILLEDYALLHRAKDQAELPLADVSFGAPIDAGSFRRQVSELFGWSVARGCRFVVDLYDETGSDKAHYKLLKGAVEANFFIRPRG